MGWLFCWLVSGRRSWSVKSQLGAQGSTKTDSHVHNQRYAINDLLRQLANFVIDSISAEERLASETDQKNVDKHLSEWRQCLRVEFINRAPTKRIGTKKNNNKTTTNTSAMSTYAMLMIPNARYQR
jgi:hypothetical protein